MSVRLSARRLGEAVALSKPEKKFTFIVGKEMSKHVCTLLQACFISGKVCQAVSSDPTTDTLRVLPDEDCSAFELIENLWNGESINITTDNVNILYKLGCELENEELVNLVFASEELSVGTCISRLGSRHGMDLSREIEFISSHFSEFKALDLLKLRVDELESILTHESFKIESENALLDYIQELSSLDESYSCLLRYVQFEYLDSEYLDMFFELVYPDHIDSVLWQSITEFIAKSVKSSPPKMRGNMRFVDKRKDGVFEYNSSDPFNGIVSHLRNECGGNPHVEGLMNITASSVNPFLKNGEKCYNVIDYGWNKFWTTNNAPDSWIQFDFKDSSISLQNYTIKSDGNVNYHLQQWKIEGSNDAQSWTQLDARQTSDLNGTFIVKNFVCSTQTENSFRFIRLTQTGPNTGCQHCLLLSEIEFFGTLKLEKDTESVSVQKPSRSLSTVSPTQDTGAVGINNPSQSSGFTNAFSEAFQRGLQGYGTFKR